MLNYGTSPSVAPASTRRTPYLIVAAVAGLAAACVLLLSGVLKPADPTELYQVELPGYGRQFALNYGRQSLAASYIDKWSHLAAHDFQSPVEILAAKEAGIPVIYPSRVIDKSGKLQKLVPAPMLREIQKPLFNVVPASQSSQLACICDSCGPYAGFPPVCVSCKCEEAEANEDVWFLGHTRACQDDECDDLRPAGDGDEEGADDKDEKAEGDDKDEKADEEGADDKEEEAAEEEGGDDKEEGGDDKDDKDDKEEGADDKEDGDDSMTAPATKNALLDFPECETWACYNKDGWFCACTCPGEGC